MKRLFGICLIVLGVAFCLNTVDMVFSGMTPKEEFLKDCKAVGIIDPDKSYDVACENRNRLIVIMTLSGGCLILLGYSLYRKNNKIQPQISK